MGIRTPNSSTPPYPPAIPIPTIYIKAEEITVYVVYGLSTFSKYNNGKYPP